MNKILITLLFLLTVFTANAQHYHIQEDQKSVTKIYILHSDPELIIRLLAGIQWSYRPEYSTITNNIYRQFGGWGGGRR
ncbi:MAG TPA: hypothetical protein VKR58_06330 [Aquella sp.]|nr:hypothetical protein [Aquella sp.]